MTITRMDAWLASAVEDAERRGLGELKPLLETVARSTSALREADRVARLEAAARDEEAPADARGA